MAARVFCLVMGPTVRSRDMTSVYLGHGFMEKVSYEGFVFLYTLKKAKKKLGGPQVPKVSGRGNRSTCSRLPFTLANFAL